MKPIEERAQEALDALNQSVAKALDKKRRLGQHAVIWDGEKVVYILPDGTISTPPSRPKQKPQT